MAYTVELDIYSGPLDLLVYLIDKEEVDIYDIPISLILEKYLEHLDQVQQLDINLAAEFLVMASTLMEIKSKMLLPVEDQAATTADEEDPRGELVRQLLAFRAFKEAAGSLGELHEIRSRRYGRGYPIKLPDEDKPKELEPVKDANLFELGTLYANLVKQTLGQGPRTIVYDELSMEDRVAAISAVLEQRPEFALQALFEGRKNVYEKVGTFFALLEMVRDRLVRIFQNSEFSEIIIKRYIPPAADGPEPPGTYVDPHLPQPRELPTADNKRAWKMGRVPSFDGFIKGENGEDIKKKVDDAEFRLNRRIDEILGRADEISERFEASRAGRLRQEAEEGDDASASLDDAMAAFDDEVGPMPDEPEGGGEGEGDGAPEGEPGEDAAPPEDGADPEMAASDDADADAPADDDDADDDDGGDDDAPSEDEDSGN